MAAGFIGTIMSCLLILLAVAVALAVCVQIVKRRAVAAVEDMMGVEGSGCVPKLELFPCVLSGTGPPRTSHVHAPISDHGKY